jgi:CubicO group peptidase (beta-lactamase class C family)
VTDPPTVARLQEALDGLCAARGIPGAVCGVVVGDTVTVAASGTANLNTGLPVVRETLFQAGSIGKSYTATVLLQLADDKLVDLDAPLREYLPDLAFADPEVSKTLTSRQVLTHCAGIDGDRLDSDGACGRGDDCLQRYVESLADLPLIAEPGRLWSYCNSGYIVLGRVIEVVTGMTYEQALTTGLLEPLGAEHTLFFPGDMVMHSLAVAHVRQGDGPATVAPKWEMSRAAGPAGATINTTIDDLLAFAALHLRGGLAADGTRLLTEQSALEMRQPLVPCPEPELLGDHWGLGFFVRTGSGPVVVGHDGNTLGETACLRLIPERGAAWALLMNLAGQNWAAMELAQEVFDPWLGTVTPGRPEPQGVAVEKRERLVGTYESVGASLVVSPDDAGGLDIELRPTEGAEELPEMRGVLLPVAGDRFVLRMPALGDDSPVTFLEADGDGRCRYLHMGARLHRRVSADAAPARPS